MEPIQPRTRFDRRRILFGVFAFCLTATLAFLGVKNLQSANSVNYSGFKAGNIISDEVMSDYNSMAESEIQAFLKSKNSCNDTNLARGNDRSYSGYDDGFNGIPYNYSIYYAGYGTWHYHVTNGHFICMADETFNGETAAHIIYTVAQQYKINPKVLIVTLQKEQALVTDTYPSQTEYLISMGFGCPDSGEGCMSTYYGFKKQITSAAKLFREVLDGGWTNYPVGNNFVQYNPNTGCGGSTVYIENRATSALYRYTPYQPNAAALAAGYGQGDGCSTHGNRNFYAYYTDWFGDTHSAAAKTSVTLPGETYQLMSSAGLALSFSGASAESGAQLKTASDTDTLQQFNFERTGNYYKLKNVATGLYLTAEGTDNGSKVKLAADTNDCHDEWLVTEEDGRYRFVSACFVYSSLDILGNAADTIGTTVQIYSSNREDEQTWNLTVRSAAKFADGDYTFSSAANSGYRLDVYGATAAKNGTNVQIYPANGSSSQKFKITRDSLGYYKIYSYFASRYIETSDGNVYVWAERADNCIQKWNLLRNSDGTVTFASSCSGSYVMDVSGGSAYPEANVILYKNHNSSNQRWILNSLNPAPADNTDSGSTDSGSTNSGSNQSSSSDTNNQTNTSSGNPSSQTDTSGSSEPRLADGQLLADGVYAIESGVGSLFYLDINGSSAPQNGTNAQIWHKNSTNSQRFRLAYNANNGFYRFTSLFSNTSLDANGAVANNGVNVTIWGNNGSCAQYWKISKISNTDDYRIASSCNTGYSLDVEGAHANLGQNVQLYVNNTTKAQRWIFHKIN